MMKSYKLKLLFATAVTASIMAAFVTTAAAEEAQTLTKPTATTSLDGSYKATAAVTARLTDAAYKVDGKNVELDLNGYTVKNTKGTAIEVTNGGTLTIIDSMGSGNVGELQGSSIGIHVHDGGTVYLKGGEVSYTTMGVKAESGSHVILDGGTLGTTNLSSTDETYAHVYANNSTVTLKSSNLLYKVPARNGIAAFNGSIVNIEGGGIAGNSKASAIYADGSTVNVSGGEVRNTGSTTEKGITLVNASTLKFTDGVINARYAIYAVGGEEDAPCAINMSGGRISSSTYAITADNDNVRIDGGTINASSICIDLGTDTTDANLIVNDGTITITQTSGDGSGIRSHGGTTIINGGTINGYMNGYVNYHNGNASTLIINGGTLTNNNYAHVNYESVGITTPAAPVASLYGGLDCTINGGTFTNYSTPTAVNSHSCSVIMLDAVQSAGSFAGGTAAPFTLTINDGSFPGEVYAKDTDNKNASTLTINGGSFGSAITRTDIGEFKVSGGVFTDTTGIAASAAEGSASYIDSSGNLQVGTFKELAASGEGTYRTGTDDEGNYSQITVSDATVQEGEKVTFLIGTKEYDFDFGGTTIAPSSSCRLGLIITDIPEGMTVTVALKGDE